MYHACASHCWSLINNQYIPLKTIRESCDCLAGGASERAGWMLGSCWWSSSTWQRNVSSLNLRILWIFALKGLRGPQCLPTGQELLDATKVHELTVLSVMVAVLLSVLICPSNSNIHIKTGCKHTAKQGIVKIYCANFSGRTNAAVLGITFITSSDSNPVKSNIATQ